MFKRILGIVLLLVGLLGLLISVGGTIVSQTVIGGLGDSLETTLTLALDSLDTVTDTLTLTKTTVEQAVTSIDTLAEAADNVSTTMDDTQPLMDKVTVSATARIPDSIEAIQDSLPNVAEAAGAIDDTLRVLDSFELNRQVFGIPIQFDLGINYQPSVPLDETVLTLGQSLDGIPEDLRALEADLLRASENLSQVSGNIETIGGDLELISQTVDEISPLLDQYIDIVEQTQDLLERALADLDSQMAFLQLAITVLFVWLGLNQIVPLYLGWTLMTGYQEDESEEEAVQDTQEDAEDADKRDTEKDVIGEDEPEADESS